MDANLMYFVRYIRVGEGEVRHDIYKAMVELRVRQGGRAWDKLSLLFILVGIGQGMAYN